MCCSEEGFGFSLKGTNLRSIIDFIIKKTPIPDNDAPGLEALADAGDIHSLEELFDAPVSWVVADLINEAEELTLIKGYRDNGHSGEYVGIDPRFVWFMTERDKAITKADAERILRKYYDAFGGKGAIGYFDIYFNTEEQA